MAAPLIRRVFSSLSSFMPKIQNLGVISATGVVKPGTHSESPLLSAPTTCQQVPVRTHFVNWHMFKDHKRRLMVGRYYPSRQRLNCIRKNKILPREIQEIADMDIDAFPRDSNYHRTRNRCILTSRPRGRITRWRLSRIMWRHFADYNQMSGVTRSCW